ncbi:hypothetical protein [Peptoanaerobacter stomatis]|uniref:Twitching motility protein PilT n=1 Tax=Peptoanaerobacter stomatis TaxID=796937 RepID=G9XDS8_9FIRM|nr:hypothetical protein [Peptoanaerobacter stomatis]EHL18899.1 hypothetical protein HMPREF9628_01951 [Peptoanaerobacter stomatis]
MVKLLIGSAGSGKTKVMIDEANKAVEGVRGTFVYVESTDKHSHLLNRNIRLVATEDLKLKGYNGLYGFICGMTSANYDIQKIYIDGLFKVVDVEESKLYDFLEALDKVSDKYETEIVISATLQDEEVKKQVEKFIIA